MRISDWSSDVCSSDLLADLRVEDGVRRLAGQIVDDLDILTAGVEDLEHRFIVDEEVEQRFQVDAGRHRVDRSGMVAVGDLDQAQFGPEGVFAHEFGIDRDEIAVLDEVAEFGERGRSEEHTSELQSLMRISYAVFCLKKKTHEER